MKAQEVFERTIDALTEAPFYAELQGRDGLPCRVWKNPSKREFAEAVRRGDASGLRGLITGTDLFVWQSMNLLHADFERETGISGVRVALRSITIQVNDETVDQPDQFPWIFPHQPDIVADMDIEDRREIVTQWLLSDPRLRRVYPAEFQVVWYS